ncbi:MAG: HesA/MoeB/ThiF family protein [Candidatus Bathyarchaeota archaeon]|nr:MAG: HesA/MoeB/ThiF family protein [Candidatus Bathyarchaeota archaeon]
MIKSEKSPIKSKPSRDLEGFLQQLPSPPEEHTHELKMEQRVKRLLGDQERLTDAELRFYARQIMLDEVGLEGQLKLRKSKACVIGLGGLGSTIATQLTAMGVGYLRVVDRDIVEESNLQRQHLYNFDVIGLPKVEAATRRLERLNPHVRLDPIPVSFNEGNSDEVLSDMDVVLDGLDNMKTRYAVNRACVESGLPFVFGSAISTFGNVSTIIPGETPCLECFYGGLEDRVLPTCSTMGIHPSVLGVVASIEVAEAVKILLDKPPSLKNKLYYCDISALRFETIDVAHSENCPVCGKHPKGISPPLKHILVEETCGRNNKKVFITVPKKNLNLDIEKLITSLEKEGARITMKAKLGVALATAEGIAASILSSGIMIIEGTKNEEETLNFYKRMIVTKMGIPWTKIG